MNLKQLREVVRSIESRALLVSPRVLRRMLVRLLDLDRTVLSVVPHALGCSCPRETLCQYVDEDELELEPDQLLPAQVILLPRPTVDELRGQAPEQLLLQYWRRLFHVSIHEHLEPRFAPEILSEETLRERIDALGRSGFDEIRQALVQEQYLAPESGDRATLLEFLSVYFELRHFCPGLLKTFFPSIRDWDAVERLARAELESEPIFARTRPPGAANPTLRHDDRFDETHDYFWRLIKQADQARHAKDTVRAAVLHTKALRIAPSEMTAETRSRLQEDLRDFAQRLKDAFRLGGDQCFTWQEILPSLLEKVDHGEPEYELRLLEGLQRACVDHERRLYELNVVDWAVSLGRRPIQRPLSRVQLLRLGKHLRQASQRLPQLRLSLGEREKLRELLDGMLQQTESRSRERFRPILEAAFRDVGMNASNAPERVALRKMIEELLDRIVHDGFLTFSHLRDAVSRNQLKMPDLQHAREFRRGDALARLDRTLKALMDGVYHPGEFYLRGMERVGSLAFGTQSGRFVCRNVLLPFGGSFLFLTVLEHLLHFFPGLKHIHLAPSINCWFLGGAWLAYRCSEQFRTRVTKWIDHSARWWSSRVWRPLVGLWDQVDLQEWQKSWAFSFAWWYVLAPLLIFQPLWWACPYDWKGSLAASLVGDVGPPSAGMETAPIPLTAPTAAHPLPTTAAPIAAAETLQASSRGLVRLWLAGFAGVLLLVNSRFGYACGEALAEGLQHLFFWLGEDVLRQASRAVTGFFKQVWAGLESLLYAVHDWLRATSDDDWVSYSLRLICGVLWAPFDYLIRFFFVVVIEPNFNPIKLIISFIIAKMMVPLAPEMTIHIIEGLTPLCGRALAATTAGGVIFWVIPGAGAFLVWEIQENWRLFRANRPPNLEPVAVGHHGETILELLRPGFHSGTIPRLFQHLRSAEKEAYAKGQWRAARTRRAELEVVSHAVAVFIEREFLALLAQCPAWPAARAALGEIRLTARSIQIELLLKNSRSESVWIRFDECSGWLVGRLASVGWLGELEPSQRTAFFNALLGMFQLAGVHFVPEQLEAAIPDPWRRWELAGGELLAWETERAGPKRYPLHPRWARAAAEIRAAAGLAGRSWELDQAMFSRVPLGWQEWTACWESAAPLPGLLGELEESLEARVSPPPRPERRLLRFMAAADFSLGELPATDSSLSAAPRLIDGPPLGGGSTHGLRLAAFTRGSADGDRKDEPDPTGPSAEADSGDAADLAAKAGTKADGPGAAALKPV